MRDLLSKLDSILNENKELNAIKNHPEADDPRIQRAIADKEKEEDSVEETSKFSPTDDVVGFTVNSEKAYNVVMRQFGDYIDWDEDEGVMYVPEKMWPKVEMAAFDADGEGATRVEDEQSRDWNQDDIEGYADRSADADAEEYHKEGFEIGDAFGISFSEDFEIGTEIVDILEDGIVISLDDAALEFLTQQEFTFEDGEIVEGKQHGNSKIYDKCWKGYKKVPGKDRGEEGSCVKEAEYQGRKVPLGKPMAGDVKKSKVYVKNDKGNVVKVNFGDKKMKIKKSNPNRRKSFRARHNCSNPGPRWKARYWSCRAW